MFLHERSQSCKHHPFLKDTIIFIIFRGYGKAIGQMISRGYIKRDAIWKSLSLVLTETHGERVNTLSLPCEREPPRKAGGAGPVQSLSSAL